MDNNSFNILHLSDFHVDITSKKPKFSKQIDFHTDIVDLLINNFISRKSENTDETKKKVDYLVLTGDFGNQCEKMNVDKATELLEKLKTGLQLESKQIICCAGNHDMDKELLKEPHHNKSFDIQSGHGYIKDDNKYPRNTFERYNQLVQKLQDDRGHDGIDYIHNTEHADFLVLNSSWLSQIGDDETATIMNDLLSETDGEKIINELRKHFKNRVCLYDDYNAMAAANSTDVNKQKHITNRMFKPSFNYSENTRQQINNLILEKIKHENPEQQQNIKIIICHHPDDRLHYLEHFPVNEIQESGTFEYLSDNCDFLICGHTHPKTPDFLHSKLMNLIGGGCHLTGNNKSPLFFFYEGINKNNSSNKISCKRHIFRFCPPDEIHEQFKPTLKLNKYIDGVDETVALRFEINNVDFNTPNKTIPPLTQQPSRERDTSVSPYLEDVADYIDKMLFNFTDIYCLQLESFFRSCGFEVKTKIHNIRYKKQGQETAPAIVDASRVLILTISQKKYYILLDIFSHQNMLYDLLEDRFKTYNDVRKFERCYGLEEGLLNYEHYCYIPIHLDIVYALLDVKGRKYSYNNYRKKVLEKLNTAKAEGAKSIAGFYKQFLKNMAGNVQFPYNLSLGNYVKLDKSLLTDIYNNNTAVKITYNNTNNVLTTETDF